MHPSQNHLKTDDFCQENSNPTLYEEDKKKGLPAILDKENSEAAEQTFRQKGGIKPSHESWLRSKCDISQYSCTYGAGHTTQHVMNSMGYRDTSSMISVEL